LGGDENTETNQSILQLEGCGRHLANVVKGGWYAAIGKEKPI
jgi:hypothetical protein